MLIGQNIYELRKARNITQESLASAVGVSAQAVSKWEGGGTPDVELLPKIADYFGISLDALFGRTANDYSNLETELLKSIAEIPREQRFKKAFDYCWLIQNGLMGSTELEITVDDILEKDGKKYRNHIFSEILWNNGITKMALDESLRYFLIMPEPACGWKKELGYKDRYADLFAILGDRNTLKALYFLYERENKPFTPRLIEKAVGLDGNEASQILEKLVALKFVATSTIELDDEAKTVYSLVPNPAFVGWLAMSEDLLEMPRNLAAGGYHDRIKPYLAEICHE